MRLRVALIAFCAVSVAFAVFSYLLAPDADSMGGLGWIDRVDTAFIVLYMTTYAMVLAAVARLLGVSGRSALSRLVWVAAGALFVAAVAGGIEDGFRVGIAAWPYVSFILLAWLCQLAAGIWCATRRGLRLLGLCLAVPVVAAVALEYPGWVFTSVGAAPLIWLWSRRLQQPAEATGSHAGRAGLSSHKHSPARHGR